MPTTYEPIATTTLGSAAASISFTSIPATYTDLRLVFVGTPTSSSWVGLRINSDSGSNYSETRLLGDGSSAQSSRSPDTYIFIAPVGLSTTLPSLIAVDLFSYAGSTNKTLLSNFNADANGSGFVGRLVGLWRSTSAINRLDLSTLFPSGNFATGTTVTLYGIKNA
jgi:hypothetical protein